MPIRVNRKALVVLLIVVFALAAGTVSVLRLMLNKGARSAEFLKEAREYAARGQYDSAIIQYRSAIKYNPENIAAEVELGDLYARQGDLNQAYECYKAVVTKEPANVEVLGKLATLHYLAGNWDELRRTAAAMVSLAPGGRAEAQAHHYLAQTYYREGQWRSAAAEFARAAEMNGDDVDAVLAAALINAQKLGAPAEAQLGLKQLLSRTQDQALDVGRRAEAALRAAKFYWAAGDPAAAEKMLATATSLVPGNATYHVQTGDFYKQRGRDAESLALAEKAYLDAIKAEPESATAQLALGVFYRDSGRLDRAVEVFGNVAAVKPAPLVYQYLIESLIDKGDLARAAGEISALRKIKNGTDIADYLEGRLNLVESKGSGEKTQRAGELFRRVLRQKPGFAPAHHYLGLVLAALGMFDDAAVEFQKALEISPEFDAAAIALAEVYTRSFQFEKAIVQARNVLGRDSRNYLANLVAGRVLAAQGNLSGARTFLEQARSLRPDSVDPLIALADVLYRQERFAQAVALLEDAAAHTQDKTRAAIALASIYLNHGDAANALEVASNAAAAAPQDTSATAFYASLLWQVGRADDALSFLAGRAAEFPSRADCQALLGDYRRSLGKGDEALESYKQALAVDPSNQRALSGSAAVYTARGDYSQARLTVETLRKSDPASPEADMAEAGIFTAEGKPDAAAALLENIIRQNPSRSDAYYSLALIQEDRGELDKAVGNLKSALRFNPSWIAARLALAQLYYRTRFYEDALREARRVTGAADAGLGAISQAASIAVGSLVESRRLDEAISQWTELPPDIQSTGDYMLKLGYLQLMQRDYARAEDAFKKAAESLADPSSAYEGLARVYVSNKDFEAAASTAERALAASPSQAAKVRLLHLTASISLAAGDADAATAALSQMQLAAGKDPSLLVQTGDAFSIIGRDDRAVEAYRKAWEINEEFAPATRRLVEALIRQGKTAEAADIAEKMLKGRKDDLDLVALRAQTLVAENTPAKLKQAADMLNGALQARSGGARAAAARYLLGFIYYRLGQMSTCETQLRMALAEDPSFSAARVLLAKTLVANRAYEEAAVIANEAISANPDEAEAYAILGDVSAISGDVESAVKWFRKALSVRTDPAVLRALVNALAKTGKTQEALAEARAYLEAVPGDPDTMRLLAAMYESQGDYGAAERTLVQLLDSSRDDVAAVYALSKVYKTQGKFAEAQALLKESIRSAPMPLAYRYLAGVQALAGRREDAEATLREAVKKYPESLDSWSDLAALLADAGRAGEAAAVLKDAISRNKDRQEPYLVLGQFYTARNMTSEAEKFLRETADGNPKFATVLGMLGGLYLARGDKEAALETFEKAVRFSPDDPRAANTLAYVLADEGIDAPRAVELATFASTRLPNDPAVLDTLGWAYYRNGQYGNAVASLASAVRYPGAPSAPTLYHLSLAYAKVGAASRANETARQLVALDGSYGERPEIATILSQQ